MSKKKYIGIICDEFDNDIQIGYDITTNLKQIKEWQFEILECVDVVDCKIYQLREIK